MRLAIGCDEAAFQLKEVIRKYVEEKGMEVDDYGVYNSEAKALYPDVAVKVSESVATGKNHRAILICGTGIGMAISANKVPGIRAAVCHDMYSAERSRKSNNCQILCLGARVVGLETAKSMVDVWLESEFQGGRSQPKVDKINEYEQKYLQGASANK